MLTVINEIFFQENVYSNFKFPSRKTEIKEQVLGQYFLNLKPSPCLTELHTSLTVSFEATRRFFMLVFESRVWNHTFLSDI